jgi:hypothetical protein
LLGFFSDLLHFHDGQELIRLMKLELFHAVSALLNGDCLNRPACWALLSGACYATCLFDFSDSRLSLQTQLAEIINLNAAVEELVPGMHPRGGYCCMNEYSILCLLNKYVFLFQQAPWEILRDEFMEKGDVILPNSHVEMKTLFIELMGQILNFSDPDVGMLASHAIIEVILEGAIDFHGEVVDPTLSVLNACLKHNILVKIDKREVEESFCDLFNHKVPDFLDMVKSEMEEFAPKADVILRQYY